MVVSGSGSAPSPSAQDARVVIRLSLADAQALYDHTGTMPFAPGSWSGNVRAALSEGLYVATRQIAAGCCCSTLSVGGVTRTDRVGCPLHGATARASQGVAAGRATKGGPDA